MKKTDIIIRFDPANNYSNSLQIVVLDTPKYGKQITELNEPKCIAVPLDEGQWAKLSIDKRETVKVNGSSPKKIFDYICYTITTEDKDTEIEPDCEYFISCSTPYKNRVKKNTKVTSV